jgi:hypothetical protein
MLRPVVHCQTIRYNSKKRAGKGFSLDELKEAGVNKKEARGIGISVDYRRKNRSEGALRENVARLSAYKANLIVFPKKMNRKKPQATDSSKAEQSKAEQVVGDVMPIVKAKPGVVPYKITQVCSLPSPKSCSILFSPRLPPTSPPESRYSIFPSSVFFSRGPLPQLIYCRIRELGVFGCVGNEG